MTESIPINSNQFINEYCKGRIAAVIAEKDGWKLTAGQICLKIPDIRLNEIMAWAGVVVDLSGNSDPNTKSFEFLQRDAAQGWIDSAYKEAPEIAERLDRELNHDEEI